MNNQIPPAGNMEPASAPRALEKNGHYPVSLSAPSETPAPVHVTLWRLLALPLLLAVTCGLSAWVVTSFCMTRWYQSGATLYFPSANGGGNGGLLQQITGATGGDPAVSQDGGLYSTPLVATTPNMAMSVLATGRVQGKVMADLRLDKRWHLSGGEASQRLGKNVSYGMDRNGFLAIQAQDPNPALTVEIVNSYIKAMQQVSTELTTLLARRNRAALQNRLDQLSARLLFEQNALTKLQMQTNRSTPLGPGAQSAYQALDAQRQQTQVDLKVAQTALAARLHTAQVTTQNAANLPAQLPYAQQARQRLIDLEVQFAATRKIYGPDYPQYQQQQAELQQAQTQYQDEVKRETLAVQKGITPDVAQLKANVLGLQAKLDGIDQAAAPLRSDLQSLPLDQMRQTQLEAHVALDSDQVKAMTLEVERAQEVEDRTAPAFEVIDGAGLPGEPVLPRVWFTTVFAAIAGFLLGLAWLAGRVAMRQAIAQDVLTRIADGYKMIEPSDKSLNRLQLPSQEQITPQNHSLVEAAAPDAKRKDIFAPLTQPDAHE